MLFACAIPLGYVCGYICQVPWPASRGSYSVRVDWYAAVSLAAPTAGVALGCISHAAGSCRTGLQGG